MLFCQGLTSKLIHYKKKNVYYNERKNCDNIIVVAIVEMMCCNKI